jgi:tRNA threonylcarbamoyladenosine biosynthesis protein TsaE
VNSAEWLTANEAETIAAGRQIAALLPARGLVLLTGDLGAGKTTLVKGIAAGRGIATPDEVTSPTFPLIHEYGEPVRIYHVDLYRLDTEQEVLSLGLDDLIDSRALVLIEWGERFPRLWPPGAPQLHLKHLGGDQRLIRLVNG